MRVKDCFISKIAHDNLINNECLISENYWFHLGQILLNLSHTLAVRREKRFVLAILQGVPKPMSDGPGWVEI